MTDAVRGALLWVASFAFACGVFFCLALLLRDLPPTPPVAIGVVTIEQTSKARDYAAAALFFLLVPPLTIYFRSRGEKLDDFYRRVAPSHPTLVTILFAAPYIFSPLLYLTTGKVGWTLLLPAFLSNASPRVIEFFEQRRWARLLFRRELRPFHALLVAEGSSWILFRYLVTWRRIGHLPTLFLEIVFVAGFLAIFWFAAVLISRIAQLAFDYDAEDVLRRLAMGGTPMVAMPYIAIAIVPTPQPSLIVIAFLLLAALIAVVIRRPPSEKTAWKLAAYIIFPALIYCFSYGSSAHSSQWIDLFHRGETIGPASDYLRGKVPYRGTFPIHGMLEDGLLDAWLMQLFGRTVEVSVAQTVILGALLSLALWYLGIIVFESIPLALLVVAMGAWTTAENNRTFFQVAAVALLWYGLSRRRRVPVAMAGVIAGIALFFSYEIGVYSIVGGLVAIALLAISARRVAWQGLSPSVAALSYLAGALIGTLPFLMYLGMRGAAIDFLTVSFVVIPRAIDAVWSLPFPDLVSTFRRDLSLHTLSDFILSEKLHLILSPLAIVIAATYYLQRWLRRKTTMLDQALLVLTVFAVIAQRTAFGRAEFRHQYFAAFLLGPMLVLLALLFVDRLRNTWNNGETGERAFIALMAALIVLVAAILFWIPDLINTRIDDFARYQGRVLRVVRDPAAEQVADRIRAIKVEVDDLTSWRDPIFDFSNQPALYFFCDRPNPTRFYQIPILSPKEFQAETIQALEATKPKIVIKRSPESFDTFDGVPNSVRAQAVSAYIDDCYQFYETVRGVEIWRRKRGAIAAPVAQYLTKFHVPGPDELVNPGYAREVFPVIGSAPGVGGAYWQSDLTMHNPSRQPVSVVLRYISGDVHVDRRVTLAPRRTVRWDDVVKTFFRAPESQGTLWLEYVNGHPPVAVVRTWDSAHNTHGTIDTPLTMSDSATAGSETPELAIVGIPAANPPGRRINIAVVNAGIIPGTFRISVRTRTGAMAGRPIESGVGEDSAWVVRDVESELGTAIDEGMIIRITAIAGTGLAYASVVGPTGDVLNIQAVPAQP